MFLLWAGLPILGYGAGRIASNFSGLAGPNAIPGLALQLTTMLATPAFMTCAWVIPVVLLFAFWKLTQDPDRRTKLDDFLSRIPWIGQAFYHLQVAMVLRTLGQLLQSGVKIQEALDLTGKIALRTAFARVSKDISEGQTLAGSFRPYFPSLAVQMIDAGEASGHLHEMLLKSSDILEEESNYRIQLATQMLEPALLLGVGFLVGGVCLMSLGPLIKVVEQL